MTTAATTASLKVLGTSQVRPEPVTKAIVSRDGELALSAQLERLRHQLQVEFPERLREARGFGEIGQNDEYLQIKEEEAVIASRIQRLQALLFSATVVDPSQMKAGATIGTIVEVREPTSGELRALRLTGGYEDHGPDDVSASSPIGQGLLGRARGDRVRVDLPGNRSVVLEIVNVHSRREA